VVHAGTPAFLASLALALGGFSCAFINESDHVNASKRGDTSMPAERRSPIAELRVCGDGDVTATGRVIRRHPYLQQVTKTSAMIGWTTTSPKDQHVDITLPDGSPVASVAAIVEPNYRRSDTKQVWATVTGLAPGTAYCYSIANGTRLTERTGFRTAPSSTDAPVRFLAFGDSGVGGGDQRTLRNWMLDFPFDLIVHTGDVAYSDGSLGQYERNVFGIYGQMFRNVPFFPAPGNHDYRTMDGESFRYVLHSPARTTRCGTRTTGAAFISSRSIPRLTTKPRHAGSQRTSRRPPCRGRSSISTVRRIHRAHTARTRGCGTCWPRSLKRTACNSCSRDTITTTSA
jgi:hypothetical protein